jgi:hypothetical protein
MKTNLQNQITMLGANSRRWTVGIFILVLTLAFGVGRSWGQGTATLTTNSFNVAFSSTNGNNNAGWSWESLHSSSVTNSAELSNNSGSVTILTTGGGPLKLTFEHRRTNGSPDGSILIYNSADVNSWGASVASTPVTTGNDLISYTVTLDPNKSNIKIQRSSGVGRIRITNIRVELGCINGTAYGSGSAPATGSSVTMSPNCHYAGEYATLNNVSAGTNYTATSSIGSDWITIRQGTSNGPAIAFGQTPLSWTSTVAGTYFVHVNTNNSCGTQNSCRTLSVQRPAPPCTPQGNPAVYGSESWIGYVYNSASAGAFTTYQGFVTEATVFNRTHTTASGATINHCSTNQDLFAIRYRNTTNFPAGLYTFTVGGDDGVRFSIDGGATWLINQWVDQSYTTVTSAAVSLSGNTNMILEYYENGGGSQSSFNYTFTTCTPSQPSTITGITNPIPGNSQVYSVTNTSGVSYTWNFPAGWNITSGQGTNSVTVTVGSTNGTISVTPSNGCGIGTARTTTSTIPLRRIVYNSVDFGSANWCVGETRTVTLNVTNTGTESFSTANAIRFGHAWGANWYDSYPAGTYSTIAPGQSGDVTFSVTSPGTAGATALKFSTVKDGVCWFHWNADGCGPGNIEYSTTITVNASPTVSVSATPTTVCAGQTSQLSSIVSGTSAAPTPITLNFTPTYIGDEARWEIEDMSGNLLASGGPYFNTSLNQYTSTFNVPIRLRVRTDGTWNDNTCNWQLICNGSPVGSGSVDGGQNTIVISNVSCSGAASVSYVWSPSSSLNNATIVNPIASPSTTTTYTVTATSNGCSATDQVTVTVINPAFTIQPQATSICTNGPGSFTVATNAVSPSYQWQYSTDNVNWANTDGAAGVSGHTSATLSLVNPDITWNGFYIRCILTSQGCSTTSNAVVMTIVPASFGGTATAAASTICSGSSTTVSVSGNTGTIQWQQSADGSTGWSTVTGGNGGTMSTYTTPNLTTTTYYRAVVTSGACSSANSTTATVTVTPTVGTPTAISVFAGTEPTCQLTSSGTTTTYVTTATNSTGLNWSVSPGGAGTIDATTGEITWALGFSGTATIAVTANGCSGPSNQSTRSVTINAAPSVTANASSTSPCLGQSVTLTGGGATSYSWSNGVTSASQTVAPTTTTTYTLTGTVNGCSGTAQVTVAAPTVSNELSGNNSSATCTVNQNGWVHFLDLDGRLVASINSNGFNLGTVTATSYLDAAPQTVDACDFPGNNLYATAVMGRHWKISVQNQPSVNDDVKVRLPYLFNEFDVLSLEAFNNTNQNDNVMSETDLGVTKYSGSNEDNLFSNNCGNGTFSWHQQSTRGKVNIYGGDFAVHDTNHRFIQITSPSFSEFWIHGSATNSPLPVELIAFTSECQNEDAQLAALCVASI